MKITSTTGIIVIVLVLINLCASAYISQSLATRIIEQSAPSVVISELGTISTKLDILADTFESKFGHIKELHEMDSGDNGIGYEHGNIVIGLIPATTSEFENHIPYAEIIQRDLKVLAKKWGRGLEFSFIVLDAHGQAAQHLEGVQYLKSQNVSLVIGGMWSSHACASLSYCNYNDMLLFSPSSTSPLLSIPDDNLFRLAPHDAKQGPVIARLLNNRGVNNVILLQRADAWADGIYKTFEPEYHQNGGNIVKKIRYPAETNDFSSYLPEAEEAASQAVLEYGWENVGIELLSFSECVNILREAKHYPTLYNLTWYGSDATSNTRHLIDDAPAEVEKVQLISITPELSNMNSYEFRTISRNYEDLTSEPFEYYTACTYDLAMIIGESVLRAQTDDIETLKEFIPKVCNDYIGMTGNCTLDESDDRATSNYNIKAYFTQNGEFGSWDIGYYHDSGEITWYED